MHVLGYKKKTKAELIKAVHDCKSISQLCALIQHEGIVVHMQCLPGASNIPTKTLSTGETVIKSPLDNLKERVLKAIG